MNSFNINGGESLTKFVVKTKQTFFSYVVTGYIYSLAFPSGQNRRKSNLKECVFVNSVLKIRYSKYSAILSKIHSYSLLFVRFCPLGRPIALAVSFS